MRIFDIWNNLKGNLAKLDCYEILFTYSWFLLAFISQILALSAFDGSIAYGFLQIVLATTEFDPSDWSSFERRISLPAIMLGAGAATIGFYIVERRCAASFSSRYERIKLTFYILFSFCVAIAIYGLARGAIDSIKYVLSAFAIMERLDATLRNFCIMFVGAITFPVILAMFRNRDYLISGSQILKRPVVQLLLCTLPPMLFFYVIWQVFIFRPLETVAVNISDYQRMFMRRIKHFEENAKLEGGIEFRSLTDFHLFDAHTLHGEVGREGIEILATFSKKQILDVSRSEPFDPTRILSGQNKMYELAQVLRNTKRLLPPSELEDSSPSSSALVEKPSVLVEKTKYEGERYWWLETGPNTDSDLVRLTADGNVEVMFFKLDEVVGNFFSTKLPYEGQPNSYVSFLRPIKSKISLYAASNQMMRLNYLSIPDQIPHRSESPERGGGESYRQAEWITYSIGEEIEDKKNLSAIEVTTPIGCLNCFFSEGINRKKLYPTLVVIEKPEGMVITADKSIALTGTEALAFGPGDFMVEHQDSGSITVKGRTAHMFVNGRPIHQSIWGSFSPEAQSVFLTGIGVLLYRFRRHIQRLFIFFSSREAV